MMYSNGDMTTAGWIFSILGTLLLLAVIVGAAILIAQALRDRDRSTDGPAAGASAREILDRRLAAGELTIEQYRELRAALDGQPGQAGSDREPLRPAGSPG